MDQKEFVRQIFNRTMNKNDVRTFCSLVRRHYQLEDLMVNCLNFYLVFLLYIKRLWCSCLCILFVTSKTFFRKERNLPVSDDCINRLAMGESFKGVYDQTPLPLMIFLFMDEWYCFVEWFQEASSAPSCDAWTVERNQNSPQEISAFNSGLDDRRRKQPWQTNQSLKTCQMVKSKWLWSVFPLSLIEWTKSYLVVDTLFRLIRLQCICFRWNQRYSSTWKMT